MIWLTLIAAAFAGLFYLDWRNGPRGPNSEGKLDGQWRNGAAKAIKRGALAGKIAAAAIVLVLVFTAVYRAGGIVAALLLLIAFLLLLILVALTQRKA